MALRSVVKIGDDILRKKCREVTKFDERLGELLDDMYETMMANNGVGLAGPQVGMLRRIAVIDIRDNKHGRIELINPVIEHQGGSQTGAEGCLSLPNDVREVERPMIVTVRAQDRNGNEFTITGEGMLARALCHEIDHLDGVLFIDKAVMPK